MYLFLHILHYQKEFSLLYSFRCDSEQSTVVVKPFDWTFTTDYKGSLTGKGDIKFKVQYHGNLTTGYHRHIFYDGTHPALDLIGVRYIWLIFQTDTKSPSLQQNTTSYFSMYFSGSCIPINQSSLIIATTYTGITLMRRQDQCWKTSGSASSTAARKCLTKYLHRKFLSSYIQECHIIYFLFENSNLSILQVEMCGIIVHTFSEI